MRTLSLACFLAAVVSVVYVSAVEESTEVHACKPLNVPKNGEYITSNGLLQMACKKGYVPETKSSMYICRNGNWHDLFSGKVVTSLPDCVKVNIKLQVTANDDHNDLQKSILAFSWLVTKAMALSTNPLAGAAITGVEKFTQVIVKLSSGRDKSVWANIQERLENRIDDKITTNHFGTLVHLVQKLQRYMKDSKLSKKDLEIHIMTMKTQFLPQTFAYTSFNSKWTTALPAFLIYMTAAHLQLIQEGKVDKCSLARELQTIREETIQAAKALYRARFKAIVGVKSYKSTAFSGTWLDFLDGTTGKTHKQAMYDVRHMMWKITQETKKIVWDQLVDKVNKFFTKEVCLCDNLCPKPIEKKEVYWVYSFGCFGTSEDGKRQCTLPCHAYGDGYDWCPMFVSHRLPQNNLLNGNWDYCKKDQGLLKCMPVKGTTIFDRK